MWKPPEAVWKRLQMHQGTSQGELRVEVPTSEFNADEWIVSTSTGDSKCKRDNEDVQPMTVASLRPERIQCCCSHHSLTPRWETGGDGCSCASWIACAWYISIRRLANLDSRALLVVVNTRRIIQQYYPLYWRALYSTSFSLEAFKQPFDTVLKSRTCHSSPESSLAVLAQQTSDCSDVPCPSS